LFKLLWFGWCLDFEFMVVLGLELEFMVVLGCLDAATVGGLNRNELSRLPSFEF
jgi:hypothetical protein